MWKWLRSWFAWRFSLTRLVIAVLFLGAVVGLNMREIGPRHWPEDLIPAISWGWPLPIAWELDQSFRAPVNGEPNPLTQEELSARWRAAGCYRFPLTHQTYRLLRWERDMRWADPRHRDPPRDFYVWTGGVSTGGFLYYAIIDVLFALIVLALILFLQIPRRKEAAREGGRDV